MTKRHVAVLGNGIVGVSVALALLDAGLEVTLVSPEEAGDTGAASYGNAAWLSPASVVPMSMPGLWRRVPGMLLDPDGPLTLRWRAVPRLTPWLLRFLRAGATVQRVEATARALAPLLAPGPAMHAGQAAAAGVPDLIRRDGLLYVYPDRAAFEAEALAWRLRRENGVAWRVLEGEALRSAVPALSTRYAFGALVAEGGHCLDPGAYVAALARHAMRRGGRAVRARATGFVLDRGRLVRVETDAAPLACDRAVICAGIHSRPLALATGDAIPLEAERGYHVVVREAGVELRLPVQPSDSRMGITPTAAGLRAAGQVELCDRADAPDWRRADILLGHLCRAFPALEAGGPRPDVVRWMGDRPSTPDGLPVIGAASATRDVVHAYGHGHVGLVSAPMTGRLVAEILTAAEPSVSLAPYAPRRFSS